MRLRPPAVLACLFVALAASSAGAAVVEERPLAPGDVFHLRIEAGEVQVVSGDAGKVGVEAGLAPGQALRWRSAEGRKVLVVDDSERLVPRAASLRLALPPAASVVLRLGNASLRLAGVGGARLVVQGGAGDVQVETDAQRVSIDTGQGAIDARVPGGRVVARSLEGSQRIVASGPLDLDATTVGGELDVSTSGESRVRLASVSGRIAFRPSQSAGLQATLDTLSGEIDVRWPAGQGIALELAQARGEAVLPGGMVQRADGRMLLGDGAGRLVLRSYRGPIAVRVVPASGAPVGGP